MECSFEFDSDCLAEIDGFCPRLLVTIDITATSEADGRWRLVEIWNKDQKYPVLIEMLTKIEQAKIEKLADEVFFENVRDAWNERLQQC